jgi:hypothetical protein
MIQRSSFQDRCDAATQQRKPETPYLGSAVLGVAMVGVSVLGVVVLGVAELHQHRMLATKPSTRQHLSSFA